jgi:tetratricopeptide (TPR) repeat protein
MAQTAINFVIVAVLCCDFLRGSIETEATHCPSLSSKVSVGMQNFVGFGDNAMVYNRQYVISHEEPSVTVERNAFVSGLRPSTEGNYLEDLLGGAFAADGRFLVASAQPRSDGRNAVVPNQGRAEPSPIGHLPKAVFGGIAFDHFGHFLLESTSRLWCLSDYADLPWIFLTAGRTTLPAYQLGFLELLGLRREQIMPVEEWRSIDELVIPEPSFIYHHKVSLAYRDIFRRARLPKRQIASRRIFLSRSNMTIALTVGEQELEDTLAGDGWEIVYPEVLPPQEQALLFHDDNIILGLQGSAMHLGLFGPDGRRVMHLCRGQGYRGYYILDELVGAEATYFQAMLEPPLRSRPITGPFLLNIDATLAFLREEGFLGTAAVAAAKTLLTGVNERLAGDYEAWWHYTESQIRFHRQVDDDGARVSPSAALGPALQAAELRPDNSDILAHATALTLKFEGPAAAQDVLRRFRPRLATHPECGDGALLHLLSNIQDSIGNYPAALEAAERALSLDSGNPTYSNQHATVLFRLGRNAEAEIALQRQLDSGNAIAASYLLLSMLRDSADDLPGAISFAQIGVRLDRQDEGLCRHLAGLLRREGSEAAARQALSRFLESSIGSPAILIELAEMEEAVGDISASGEHLQRAFTAAPDDPTVRIRYIKSLIARGLFPDVVEAGKEPSAAIRQQSVMIYQHSLALSEGGRLPEALLVAVVAAELNPDNIVIMNNLLGLMIKNSRAADGRLLAEILIDRGYSAGEFYYVLSLIEGHLGNYAGAKDAARRAVLDMPENDVIAEHYQRLTVAA